MSQSDKWLLIYGREKAKLVVASETAFLLFTSHIPLYLRSDKFLTFITPDIFVRARRSLCTFAGTPVLEKISFLHRDEIR